MSNGSTCLLRTRRLSSEGESIAGANSTFTSYLWPLTQAVNPSLQVGCILDGPDWDLDGNEPSSCEMTR